MDLLQQFKGFCATPSIFPQGGSFPYNEFEFPEIHVNEKLRNDLENLSHPRNSVLGKRMESFFELAIIHSHRYDLINSNIQIIEDGKTLGELDFLVYDKHRRRYLHIELVYKLYIHDAAKPEWIGPNKRDSFQRKLSHLEERQFPLLYHNRTKEILKELNIPVEEVEQQICFKAKLFPSSIDGNFEDVNSRCIRGKWMSHDFFLKNFSRDGDFYSPRKTEWCCEPEQNERWMNFSEIKQKLEELHLEKRSALIWRKTEGAYQSFFVVWWN